MNEVELKLTVQELDLVIQHLQLGQWRVVNAVIMNLLSQANPQVVKEQK